MQIREIAITHRLGLHARAAARIVALASRFRCNVALVYGRRRASARSIVSVMLLAVGMGGRLRVETDGPDESDAMTAMVRLLTQGLAAPA
ncbi:MAG: HPr family phosphocarrier protein [Casimicrobiaceae bacterium]